MKKVNLISMCCLLMLSATFFTGCDKGNETPSSITVENQQTLTQTVFADNTQGAGSVNFVTTGAWTSSIANGTAPSASSVAKVAAAAASGGWIAINPSSGDKAGNYTVAITLVPNYTGADRTAVITISCNDTDITITVTQKGVKEDGTTLTDYSNLTQAEIVALLTESCYNSFNAPEVKVNGVNDRSNGNSITGSIERNIAQKKYLDISRNKTDGTVVYFDYVENLTRYVYNADDERQQKYSMPVDADYWESDFDGDDGEYLGIFDNYTWTVSGSTFSGVIAGSENTAVVELAADGKFKKFTFVDVDGVDDVETIEWAFSYGNVNPAFPAGFDKADFPEQGSEPQPFVIEAQVENGNQYDIDEVRVYLQHHGDGTNLLLASGEYENGGFTITLPATFDESYLNTIEIDGVFTGTISDPNVQCTAFEGISAYKNNEQIGELFYGKGIENGLDKEEGFSLVQYLYVDKDVSVNGIAVDDETVIYDVTLKKGWNMVYGTRTGTGSNLEVTLTTQPQSGMKWYYFADETENPNLAGKVKKINGMPVLYNNDGIAIGMHQSVYNDYTGEETEQDVMFDDNLVRVKGGTLGGGGPLIYIDLLNAGSRYDYEFLGNQLAHIYYAPNRYSEGRFEANFTWNATGNISLIVGDQYGVSRAGFLETTFEYTNTEYTLGNFDVSFYLAAQEYYAGTRYIYFDGNIGARTKNLIHKRSQESPEHKYDLTQTYRYEFNADGYITAVYGTTIWEEDSGEERLILSLEY